MNVYLAQEGEEKSHESKLYTTEKTYEELLDLANDLRTGSPKHDDHVIAVWIKVNLIPYGTVVSTVGTHRINNSYKRCCRTVTSYYGSGSDF
jgi:hypothetical protein